MLEGIPSAARRSLFARFNLEVREHMPIRWQLSFVAAGLIVGLLISSLLLMIAGVSPANLLNEFVLSIFTSSRNVTAVLVYATPLAIVGLAAAFALQARFWNIGIEGQLIFGGIGATLIANLDIGPFWLRLPLMALLAMLGGVAWIALPLFLKLKLRISEIISTLLLNYIAFNFLLHLLYGSWRDPQSAFPHSQIYDAAERLTAYSWLGVNLSAIIALLLIAISAWVLGASRFGFILNFVHSNPSMSRALGIRVVQVTVLAALVSAALAGLAGFAISSGIENRLTQTFFIGYGFSGILIAFLARNNPFGVALFALLIATITVAGQSLQVFYQIPSAVVQLIQAIIVICVAASDFFIRYRLRFLS
jgi:simple sugar transport system permease protein